SGNISELTYSDGKQVHYQYDANDRLISLTDWNGDTTSYSYDAVGHLLTTTHADSTSVTSSYDIAGRLISTSSLASDGSVIFEATYQYNAAGLLAATNTTVPLEPGIKSGAAQFSYDAANQITEMNGQTFAYDANGNMVAGMIGNTAKSIQYDALGRLMTVGQDTYEYGPDGFRVESTIGGKTVRYVQDPNAPYSRLLEEHDENGNIIARYVHGIGLVSRENSSSERSTYHYDSRGSTIALTNSFGQTTDRYAYDPYGKIVGRTGSTPNLFTYNGRDGVVDDGNGLYFMRARYYEPSLMRFIQKDIALSSSLMDTQSLNRHTYVKGNPVQYVDPDGEIVLTTILIGVAAGLATEVLFDWATGEFDPIGGDWGAYLQANKKDLIIAGVAGAFGGASIVKSFYKFKRMHKIKKFYKKAGMAMKSFKQWKKVNTIIKYGSKAAAVAAAVNTFLKNKIIDNLIETGVEAGYTAVAEGVGDAGEFLQEKGENFVEGVENAANFTKKKARKVKKFIRSIF
ncbi:MAG: hypothetical protein KUG67_02410, partial [Proteobacteria bacterium]|nr:hypothetical protein [Pseudomonadota bacterium]